MDQKKKISDDQTLTSQNQEMKIEDFLKVDKKKINTDTKDEKIPNKLRLSLKTEYIAIFLKISPFYLTTLHPTK